MNLVSMHVVAGGIFAMYALLCKRLGIEQSANRSSADNIGKASAFARYSQYSSKLWIDASSH